MKVVFTKRKALLAHFNARAEVAGDGAREPACDLKVEITAANDELNQLHPGLKALLYHYDVTRSADLADEGRKDDPEFMPHLRFPQIHELKWSDEMTDAIFTLHGGRADFQLNPVKVNNITVSPMEGGSVKIAIRVQGHPDEKQAGRLCTLVQSDIEFSVSQSQDSQQEIPPAGE